MSGLIALLVKGGPVMIPLLCCSVLSLAVVIERGWFWWQRRSSADADRTLELAASAHWEDALRLGEASPSPIARVLAAGICHKNPSATLAMEAAAHDELARLRRHLPILDTVITLSPLLGLLGTVTGMISAFGVMASSGVNQPHAITGGVAEALIATAAGLLIAIATLVPYNYFSARVERILADIERYGSRLELLLKDTRP
ncbi:MAG: MotA/TolQ/ExbB proton channel family protein [Candidatus Methylomirabilis oxyfera]|nr:MotA/TolQ/ExbB proton channel family protein [Candidatus Methylomirabilis oxyfera]